MEELRPFSVGNDEGSWRTQSFRQNVVAKIYELIQKAGMSTNRNSIEMENHVFQKAKTKEEYLGMVARLILHFRDINSKKCNVVGNSQNVPGLSATGNLNQQNNINASNSNQNVPGVNPSGANNSSNPQGQMQAPQSGMGAPPNQVNSMGNQMVSQSNMNQQGPPQQNPPIPATNLLQTLNQRPQLANAQQQMQNKMAPNMGMMPGQAPSGSNPMGPNQLQGQVVNQVGGGNMQGQMPNANMSGPNSMGNQVSANNSMANQMVQNSMNPNMPSQMVGPGQIGNIGGNQLNMMHMQQRKPNECMTNIMTSSGAGAFQTGGARSNAPGQFLRQSPSPSAPSPATMSGPSPHGMTIMPGTMPSPMSVSSGSMGVGGGGPIGSVASPVTMNIMHSTMPSPMSGGLGVGNAGPVNSVASPALAQSPSSHHPGQQHSQQHLQQHPRSVGMAPSPSSSLNTPLGAGAAPSPLGGGGSGSDDQAYREKVRQLSIYIDPLQRMIERMQSDGENVEKLTKMKKLLEILSHPSKRMPLETLLKCEAVLEKLDFKRGDRMSIHSHTNALHMHGVKEHQIFQPLLEVVNNCLQSPVANHTLERTFEPCVEALWGPEIRHMPPPLKRPKIDIPTPDIPDVLQGEIARLDSRFKVSLEGLQVSTSTGSIRLIAQLEDSRLPCVPPVSISVPRDYPASPPNCLIPADHYNATPFLKRVSDALKVHLVALPSRFSLSQLLDTWEMSVRQACNPQTPSVPLQDFTAKLLSLISGPSSSTPAVAPAVVPSAKPFVAARE